MGARREGQAVVAVTLSLVVLFGMLALAVDLGLAHFRRQAAQTAADSAALAAARAAVSAPQGISCGAGGIWCGAATACPSSAPAAASNSFDHGCMLAAVNGFTTSGGKSVTLEANTTSSVPTVPGPEVAYWVTACVRESMPTLFGIMLDGQLEPSARATAAAVTAGGGGGCIYVLDPHAQNAFQAGNGAQVNLDCGIFVNSDAKSPSRAMYVTGGALVTASTIQVSGDFRLDNGGHTSVTPRTGTAPVADPFANLPTPAVSPSCLDGNFTRWQPQTYKIPPGTYCGGMTLANGMSGVLTGGIYVVNGGTFSVQGGSRMTGSDVLIYLTNGATVNIANGSGVTLSATTTGDYKGVLFYQNRSMASPGTSWFAGGADLHLTGSLYLPKSLLVIDNGSHPVGTQMAVVAGRLSFQGGARFLTDVDGSRTGIGGGFKVALIE